MMSDLNSKDIERIPEMTPIFVEGERADELIIIKSGQVAIVQSKKNRLKLVGHRNEKEFLGEHSLFIGDGKRKLSAIAITPTEIVRINYRDIKKVLGMCPPWVGESVQSLVQTSKNLHQSLLEHRLEDDSETHVPLSSQQEADFLDAIEKYKAEKNLRFS